MKQGSMVRPLSKEARAVVFSDPFYKTCSRQRVFKDHVCDGRITIEHAIEYAGKRIDDVWALIPLCEWAHTGEGMDKRKNIQIAMARATVKDRLNYSRLNWKRDNILDSKIVSMV